MAEPIASTCSSAETASGQPSQGMGSPAYNGSKIARNSKPLFSAP